MIIFSKEMAFDVGLMMKTGGWHHIQQYIDDKIEFLKTKLYSGDVGVNTNHIQQEDGKISIVMVNTNVYLLELQFWEKFKKKLNRLKEKGEQ